MAGKIPDRFALGETGQTGYVLAVAIPLQRSLRIVSRRGEAPPSKHQLRFDRLTAKVAALKRSLQAWSSAQPGLSRLVASCQERADQHCAVVAKLVRLLDRMYADPSLTKRERTLLRGILCSTAADVLDAGGDDDLKRIYNKHSRGNYDAETATQDAMQAQMMKVILQDGFGFDFGGATFSSMDDLEQAAAEQLDEREREHAERQQAAEARKAGRKKSARQLAAEARRASETAQIGKTLQEVYRKLAMLLHPDHEQDPEERARKTLLMQEVNTAYDRKDLLQLLELRLQFEKVDQAEASTIAEDRLVHFNALLTEQVRQLQDELRTIEQPWRIQLELPTGKLTPARVTTQLQHDLRDLASRIMHAERDLEELAAPRRLKAWLRDVQAAEARSSRDPLESVLDELFRR